LHGPSQNAREKEGYVTHVATIKIEDVRLGGFDITTIPSDEETFSFGERYKIFSCGVHRTLQLLG
jgi:hypothetical protein